MKYPIYCVRDEKVGFQPQILVESSDAAAVRGFSFAVNNHESLMNFSPKDFDLFRIGELDSEKGSIIPCMPELVCSGVSVFGDKDA